MALSPAATLEAVLFASGEPLTKKRLSALLGVSEDLLEAGLQELGRNLAARGLALIDTGGEVELRTAPDAAELVGKLREAELSRDLGKASLETLAIILYKGGATRSAVDWVRGVNSTAALRSLLLRGLNALAHLGVSRMEDLPRFEEFRAAFSAHEAERAKSEIEAETPT